MLTASEIKKCVRNKDIIITPYDENQQNGQPNSYDLHLDSITRVLGGYVNPFAKNGGDNYMDYHVHTKSILKQLCFEQLSEIEMRFGINIKDYYEKLEKSDLDTYILFPFHLYLGCTTETTYTPKHIPCLSNKSSCERLGIDPIGSSGFGDIGFNGKWTLEITVKAITVLKKGMPIVQLHLYEPKGEILHAYNGKYQGQQQPTEGRFM